jgi:ADP-heptose:LPS heptosyltransferase
MRNILVLRGGALGDFIVTIPTLLALGHHWPDARIELAGNATAAELAQARGWLHAVHSQHEARWSALYSDEPLPPDFAAWLDRFDAVISYWPDPDGVLARRFPIRPTQQFVAAPAMPTLAPAARHYLAALRHLGVDVADAPDFIPLVNAYPAQLAGRPRPIAVHPGSGSPRKNWPAERWLEVIAAIADPVLLIVGEAERERWTPERQPAVRELVASGRVRLAINLPLEPLIAELSACRGFAGHDSGISHLAAACGVPCVLLFGPTDPTLWAPPMDHVRVLHRGPDLSAITVAEVVEALRRE